MRSRIPPPVPATTQPPTSPDPTHNPSEELRTNGLKATLPRLKVMEVFARSGQRHLSAEEVYRQLALEGADIGLATIYRALMQLAQAGLLSRHHFDGGKAVFEVNEGQHHDHMVCVRCGRVEEFHDAEIERRQRAVAKARGFELREHALALYGVCNSPGCRSG